MFSYGENNLVRFDRAQGIIGIFAPNASGKSSLFDVSHSVSVSMIEQVELPSLKTF